MKKALNITLNGIIFSIEEDAYQKLDKYLESIKRHYSSDDGVEILSDIESSIAEKFFSKINSTKKVITLSDVGDVIKIMGKVEEFSESEESNKTPKQVQNDSGSQDSSETPKRLYRNPDDVIIAGVCSGVAAYFDIDPVFVRLAFVVLVVMGGSGILLYFVLWLVMPEAKTNTQKLEMKGQAVNLKKIEQVVTEKTKQIAKEGKRVINQNRGLVNKIFVFPINIIRQIFAFLKKIIKSIFPIASTFFGITIVITMFFSIVALSLVMGVLIFNINSPYVVSDIPLTEITTSSYYQIGIISIYLTALIPLIFLMIFGFASFVRRNVFRAGFSLGLAVLWMVAVVVAGVSAIEIVPLARDKTDEFVAKNQVTEKLNFEGVKKVRIGGHAKVNVKQGEEFSMIVSGDKNMLDRFEYEVEDGELKVSQKRRKRGICIACFDRTIDIELIMPELESFIAYGNVYAEVGDFEKDIRVSKGESANLKVTVSGGILSSYVAGVSGKLEVLGSPDVLKLVIEGRSRFEANYLDTELVEIDADIWSRVYLDGNSNELKLDMDDCAKFYGFEFDVKNIEVNAKGYSNAEVNPIEELKAEANDYSNIIYKTIPELLNEKKYKSGKIKWLGENSDSRYYKIDEAINANFGDKNYQVVIQTDIDTYSLTMSSARGIELSPYFSKDHVGVDEEYCWATDLGGFVVNWSEGVMGKEIINDGEKIYWTFGDDNLEDLIVGEVVNVNLQIKNKYTNEENTNAKLKLEKVGVGVVRVVK